MIQGTCDPAFEKVRDAFQANFDDGLECGAAFCVWQDGRPVVDLWGGYKDRAKTDPWTEDTLVNIWSSTKGIVALGIAMLADQNALSYADKVSSHWPEFAQAGKTDMTIDHVMSHQTGLNAWREKLKPSDLFDWNRMTNLLAAQEPWWTYGTDNGYQAMTFGFLAGEIIRRVTGKTVAEFVAEEIALPLGLEHQLFIGLPEPEWPRAAEILMPRAAAVSSGKKPPEDVIMTFANPGISGRLANSEEWRLAELPAGNGHATARALAQLYGHLAQGGAPLISPSGLTEALHVRSTRADRVLPFPVHWTAGFITSPDGMYGPNPHAFGHSGRGGSFGFADPDRGIGVGYVMNQMSEKLAGDPRTVPLIKALYDVLQVAA